MDLNIVEVTRQDRSVESSQGKTRIAEKIKLNNFVSTKKADKNIFSN